MNFARRYSVNNYQELAKRTLIDKPDFKITSDEVMILWAVTGMSGEAGEVADEIKKVIFHRKDMDIEKLSEEIGDLLWYVAALCTRLGLDMNNVMDENIAKLNERYPDGYNQRDALRRYDVWK